MVFRKQINDQHRIDGSNDIVQKARHRSLEFLEKIYSICYRNEVSWGNYRQGIEME